MYDARYTVHNHFQRNRNLLLDLFRGYPGPLGDDLYVVVGDVRVGVDRQIVERHNSDSDNQERDGQHEEAIVECEIDDTADHFCSTVCWNTSALATT